MAELPLWIYIILSGIGGVLLNIFYNIWTNREKKVQYTLDSKPILSSNTVEYEGELSILYRTVSQSESKIKNLFITELVFTNTSKENYLEFDIGLQLRNGVKLMHNHPTTPDHLHFVNTIYKNSDSVKIALKPFNKKDTYKVDLYLTHPDDSEYKVKHTDIEVATSKPSGLKLIITSKESKQTISLTKFIFTLSTLFFVASLYISSLRTRLSVESEKRLNSIKAEREELKEDLKEAVELFDSMYEAKVKEIAIPIEYTKKTHSQDEKE